MEIWKPLRNFPSYNGSTEGRIINVRTQHILKPTIDAKGYAIVGLRKNNKIYTRRVHRVLADTYYGEHPGMDVRHKDENRLNNRVDNLIWVTRSETMKHAYEKGTKKFWRQIPIRVVESGNVYNTMKDCAIDIGCDPSDIRRYLLGERKSVKGYHFERV